MPATFSRTLRSMKTDGSRQRGVWLVAGIACLAAWLGWFFLGRVAVYEVTQSARLEVETAAHPVAARVGGQIVKTTLTLGREVKQGEVLVELDAESERLALEQSQTRLKSIRDRLQAIRDEIQRAKEAAVAHRKAGAVAVEEARARLAAGEAAAGLAEAKAASQATLRRQGAASEESYQEARAQATSSRATARAIELEISLLEETRTAKQMDRAAEIARLESERVDLDGKAAEEEDAIRRFQREVELRKIMAPIDGRVGRAVELSVGFVVQPAQELGSVVPVGKPRVVALFPVAAVGRIRTGQPARLRLDGFPWTQFGTPLATVADVGNEPIQGRVRVELKLDLESAPLIPLEHGLTGSAEVEVERLSPAEIALQAAGRLLSTKALP